MFMPNYHSAGQNKNMKITNGVFESLAKFRYFGITSKLCSQRS
jgi:hypothetical protein